MLLGPAPGRLVLALLLAAGLARPVGQLTPIDHPRSRRQPSPPPALTRWRARIGYQIRSNLDAAAEARRDAIKAAKVDRIRRGLPGKIPINELDSVVEPVDDYRTRTRLAAATEPTPTAAPMESPPMPTAPTHDDTPAPARAPTCLDCGASMSVRTNRCYRCHPGGRSSPTGPGATGDPELHAIATIIRLLEALELKAARRAIDYAIDRLDLSPDCDESADDHRR